MTDNTDNNQENPSGKFTTFFKDYLYNFSAARLGFFICLLVSIIISLSGLYFLTKIPNQEIGKASLISSYCNTMVLTFLGGASVFYGSSKGAETLNKKWASQVAKNVLHNDSLAAELDNIAENTDITNSTQNVKPQPQPIVKK